jgi:hypothetical protein
MKSELTLIALSPEVRRRLLLVRELILQLEASAEKDGRLRLASIRRICQGARTQNPGVQGISVGSLLWYWKAWRSGPLPRLSIRHHPKQRTGGAFLARRRQLPF